MLAVIGGTGLSSLEGFALREARQAQTLWGEPSAALRFGTYAGREVVFLPRHGDGHTLPPHRVNYRANLQALHDAGVRRVLAINTVGGIHAAMTTGCFAVPHDIIDYTWGREHTFSDGSPGSALQHVDFGEPFDAGMRAALVKALAGLSIPHCAFGVYAAAQGPRLETPAEIRRFGRDGCDIVGMTGMPEAALARELGLRYAMLCLVVNPAAGLGDAPITLEEINRVVATGMARVRATLAAFVSADA